MTTTAAPASPAAAHVAVNRAGRRSPRTTDPLREEPATGASSTRGSLAASSSPEMRMTSGRPRCGATAPPPRARTGQAGSRRAARCPGVRPQWWWPAGPALGSTDDLEAFTDEPRTRRLTEGRVVVDQEHPPTDHALRVVSHAPGWEWGKHVHGAAQLNANLSLPYWEAEDTARCYVEPSAVAEVPGSAG